MNRNLPGRMVDLIHDGVHPADLKSQGDKAVRRALVKTAMSAQARGWSDIEWAYLVMDARSRLGHQLCVKGGRKPRSRIAVQRELDSAWDYAWERRTENPARSPEEIRQQAEDRAAAMTDVVADADNDLTAAMRAVLSYAAEQTRKRGMLQVALPRHELLTATGLGLTALRTALRHLEDKGLLILVERGKPGGAHARDKRANLYALPARDRLPSECRVPRPVGPLGLPCGAPTESTSGAPAIPVGPPTTAEQEQGMEELTVTRTVAISSNNPALIRELLQELARTGEVRVQEIADDGVGENVVPINKGRRTGP